jgi:Fe-S-cluster-containing dehydrogenase component
VVQSARKPRCIACNNCVLACPFGVPKLDVGLELMMKCDMCYDRTSAGLKPMCATVCPSGALAFGTVEQMEADRPRSEPVNRFRFGRQEVTTRVRMMVPRGRAIERVDVTAAMDEPTGPTEGTPPHAGSVPAEMIPRAMQAGEEGP